MSLSAGDKLGPYAILAPIGAGGMGEVFRAHDPRLDRDVAIKVLPAAMAHDPDRLARFQREARSVAALNHPHIVTIYSVEEAAGVHFLTMEFVTGQQLDRIIPAQGLPSPTPSPPRTTRASSIAISSPPTSWSPTMAASKSSTSASLKM